MIIPYHQLPGKCFELRVIGIFVLKKITKGLDHIVGILSFLGYLSYLYGQNTMMEWSTLINEISNLIFFFARLKVFMSRCQWFLFHFLILTCDCLQ